MASSLAKQTAKWVQQLSKACDGDVQHAKRQLSWLTEKIIQDRLGTSNTTLTQLSESEQNKLETYVHERVYKNKPLQYILGTQPFCDLDIVTRPPTLIPRWETEEWTYRLIEQLRHRLDKSRPIRIMDMCTGSGCIALALAKHLPQDSAQIIGMDISTEAVDLARHNLDIHKSSLRNSVQFQQKDVFNLVLNEPIHMIVSNPPYITHEEYKTLEPDVKDWEDARALVADDEGTHVHKQIIQIAQSCRSYGNNVPQLLMEMGGTHQIQSLKKKMQHQKLENVQVWKDLADKDRVIVGY